MTEIKTWHQRCMEHPDHQTGMVSEVMIRARMCEEAGELRAELERRTRNHRKLLQGLARGDYEIVYASDEGDVVAIFPVALYEDCQSDPALDQRLIDLILNDPLAKRAGTSFPQQEGREEKQREIWRARLAQMRRVGIVISEGKT
jgi:hypothetical protein